MPGQASCRSRTLPRRHLTTADAWRHGNDVESRLSRPRRVLGQVVAQRHARRDHQIWTKRRGVDPDSGTGRSAAVASAAGNHCQHKTEGDRRSAYRDMLTLTGRNVGRHGDYRFVHSNIHNKAAFNDATATATGSKGKEPALWCSVSPKTWRDSATSRCSVSIAWRPLNVCFHAALTSHARYAHGPAGNQEWRPSASLCGSASREAKSAPVVAAKGGAATTLIARSSERRGLLAGRATLVRPRSPCGPPELVGRTFAHQYATTSVVCAFKPTDLVRAAP